MHKVWDELPKERLNAERLMRNAMNAEPTSDYRLLPIPVQEPANNAGHYYHDHPFIPVPGFALFPVFHRLMDPVNKFGIIASQVEQEICNRKKVRAW